MRHRESLWMVEDRPDCFRRSLAVLLIVLSATSPTVADGPSAPPAADYLREVKPVLAKRCFACHGALKQEAGLRLDTGAFLRKGGDSGPAIEPGSPVTSLLIERVSDSDATTRMPPEGEPLTDQQVASFRAWIGAGAASPLDEAPEPDPTDHWAFRPLVRPTVPDAGSQPLRHPIDAFLDAERERHGVTSLPPAEPAVLLRRVSLDLIGLPPTREQLLDFLADPSDEAYARVIEKLLADPRHGERWARHWMDVWRYSDWYGRRGVPDVLNSYGMIWRWRDWIVRSLNDDRPYDEMVQMMLAADELAPADDTDLVATGFLVRNFFRWNYESWKKDNVEHVGKSFLGLTFNCAHCHDHKYDPITHEDYFRFRAFFEPLELRHERVPGEPDPGPYPKYEYGKAYPPITTGLVRVMDERLDAATYLYTRGDARNVVPGQPPIAPGVPAFLDKGSFRVTPIDLPPEVSYPSLKPFVQQEEIAARKSAIVTAERSTATARQTVEAALAMKDTSAAEVEAARLALAIEEANLAHARSELTAFHARVAADLARHGQSTSNADALAGAAARAEREATVAKASTDVARAERVAFEARQKVAMDPNAQAEATAAEQQVTAARAVRDAAQAALEGASTAYTPLGPSYPARSTGRRAALARWITARENPLAARVAVNHLWRWHFGVPLVSTTADFGRNGQPPTHPALLDWLAVEFMDHGWNFKHLHRLIVTSAAYRRRSRPVESSHPSLSADPQNRLYWRFEPGGRMEAEVIRDSLLHVAGQLDGRIGGPELDQAQGLVSRRRSLYFAHHGETRMTFLELFDAADPGECYRRTESIVPQQALALTNNEMLFELGRELETRLWSAIPADHENRQDAFLTAAFEAVLSRSPTLAERALTREFLARQDELMSQNVNSPHPPGETEARARRSLIRALFSHNDFVTIH